MAEYHLEIPYTSILDGFGGWCWLGGKWFADADGLSKSFSWSFCLGEDGKELRDEAAKLSKRIAEIDNELTKTR